MKKIVLLIIAGFIFSTQAFSQDVQKESEKGTLEVTKTKSRGVDDNIKVGKRINSKDNVSTAIQPKEKGGSESRGGSCYIKFSNWTDWYIECYVNGYYEGYVAPYGDCEVTVEGGSTSLYAIAEFEDGSQTSWGPVSKHCVSCDFSIQLHKGSRPSHGGEFNSEEVYPNY